MPEFYINQIIALLRTNDPDFQQLDQVKLAVDAAYARESERLRAEQERARQEYTEPDCRYCGGVDDGMCFCVGAAWVLILA